MGFIIRKFLSTCPSTPMHLRWNFPEDISQGHRILSLAALPLHTLGGNTCPGLKPCRIEERMISNAIYAENLKREKEVDRIRQKVTR